MKKQYIKKPNKRFYIAILAIIALVGIGMSSYFVLKQTPIVSSEPIDLIVTNKEAPHVCDISSVETVIEQFVSEQATSGIEFSIGYRDLQSGCSYLENADQAWLGASTTKVILAMMVFEQVASGAMTLEQKITYQAADDYEAGAGVLQFERNLKEVDVARLSELMITESDNIAKNMLLRTLGGREAMHAFIAEKTGIESLTPTTNEVTSEQLLLMLAVLVEQETPGHREILTWMQQTTDQTRLAAIKVSDETSLKIAHKVGDYNDSGTYYLHDIAIINANHQPFILTVMTKSKPTTEQEVYDKITQLGEALVSEHVVKN